MEKQSLERTGKTVDEAIDQALQELGVGRDEVEVDVVSQGRTGILGIGSESARVRVSLITTGSPADSGAALGVVSHLLDTMGVDATPSIRSSGTGPDDPTVIDIQGEDAGLIIGSRGETLRALQYVVNIVLGRRDDHSGPIVVDVEQYRDRRQQQVAGLASRMAERAISSGRPVTLEPMSPADRRLVHVALSDDNGVTTESSGDGNDRRVTITPTGERAARPSSGGGDRRRRSSEGGDRDSSRSQTPRYRDDRD
jgi:spoIIIJ-associated protein